MFHKKYKGQNMNLNTHLKINNDINGKVVELKEGYARVEQLTKDFMTADEQGLVHGGFAFNAFYMLNNY